MDEENDSIEMYLKGYFNERNELMAVVACDYRNRFYCSKCFKEYRVLGMLKRHAGKCEFKFSNIIFHGKPWSIAYINANSQEKERLVCQKIARISQFESGWDFAILHGDNWHTAEIKSHVFLLLMADSVVSYVLFREKLTERTKTCFDEETNTKTTACYACGDVFTMHAYRRKGYAKFLLQKTLEFLGETPKSIAFLVPFTEKGSAFIQSLNLSGLKLCRS